jgi:hypothetical protein
MMGALRSKLRHAFAVDPPGPAEPTAQQQVPVDWLCRQIAMRHLTTPALVFLEMSRPLNYLSSQIGHFIAPSVWAIARRMTYENYCHFVTFLEQRGSIEYLARRVEHFEQEFEQSKAPSTADHPQDSTDDAADGDGGS